MVPEEYLKGLDKLDLDVYQYNIEPIELMKLSWKK